MRGKAKAVIIGVAVVLAFVLLVPTVPVSFSSSLPNPCGQLSLCASILMHGYGSITFWLFGAGGIYAAQYWLIL